MLNKFAIPKAQYTRRSFSIFQQNNFSSDFCCKTSQVGRQNTLVEIFYVALQKVQLGCAENIASSKTQNARLNFSIFHKNMFCSEICWKNCKSEGTIRSLKFSMFQTKNFSSDFCWKSQACIRFGSRAWLRFSWQACVRFGSQACIRFSSQAWFRFC